MMQRCKSGSNSARAGCTLTQRHMAAASSSKQWKGLPSIGAWLLPCSEKLFCSDALALHKVVARRSKRSGKFANARKLQGLCPVTLGFLGHSFSYRERFHITRMSDMSRSAGKLQRNTQKMRASWLTHQLNKWNTVVHCSWALMSF